MTRRRAPSPDLDDIDADLAATPEEIAAELAAASGAAGEPIADATGDAAGGAAVTVPLTDELDLHHFAPRECGDVVAEYLRAAQQAGLMLVRIVHGKGTGALRRTVHAVLDRHPAVRRYQLAGGGGGWGATVVELVAAPRS